MEECDGGDGWKYVVRMVFNDDNELFRCISGLSMLGLKLHILHWVSLNN